jgi:hypothetical protein
MQGPPLLFPGAFVTPQLQQAFDFQNPPWAAPGPRPNMRPPPQR